MSMKETYTCDACGASSVHIVDEEKEDYGDTPDDWCRMTGPVYAEKENSKNGRVRKVRQHFDLCGACAAPLLEAIRILADEKEKASVAQVTAKQVNVLCEWCEKRIPVELITLLGSRYTCVDCATARFPFGAGGSPGDASDDP